MHSNSENIECKHIKWKEIYVEDNNKSIGMYLYLSCSLLPCMQFNDDRKIAPHNLTNAMGFDAMVNRNIGFTYIRQLPHSVWVSMKNNKFRLRLLEYFLVGWSPFSQLLGASTPRKQNDENIAIPLLFVRLREPMPHCSRYLYATKKHWQKQL